MVSFVDKNAQLLSLLLESDSISASSVSSKASKHLFQQLEQTGLVHIRRKGAGNQYQLLNKEGLEQFIGSLYPSGLIQQNMSGVPRRVQGVFTNKNSKSLSKLDFDLVTLRGDVPLLYNGKTYDLSKLTTENIYFSLKLLSEKLLNIQGNNRTVITVENPTFFTELKSMIKIQWNIAIYTGGKMSNILIKQLEYWDKAGHTVIHFGDYEYVGLLEFSRILKVCPHARLYKPDVLTSAFLKQYGNSTLLQDQTIQHETLQQAIQTLPESIGKSELVKVYHLIQDNALGLEQESFYSL